MMLAAMKGNAACVCALQAAAPTLARRAQKG